MEKIVTTFICTRRLLKRGKELFFLYAVKGHKIISLNYRNYTCTNVLKSQVTELFLPACVQCNKFCPVSHCKLVKDLLYNNCFVYAKCSPLLEADLAKIIMLYLKQ